MKKIFIILIITSLSFSGPLWSDSFSGGLGSETMGIYGMWNLNYDIDWFPERFNYLNDVFFITAGTFIIPFLGGYGISTKYNFTSSRLSPFIASSVLSVYALPAMCSTDNCESKSKSDIVFSSSIGLDIRTYKEIYINLGVIGLHALGGETVDESPSDIPQIWPFINIRFGN